MFRSLDIYYVTFEIIISDEANKSLAFSLVFFFSLCACNVYGNAMHTGMFGVENKRFIYVLKPNRDFLGESVPMRIVTIIKIGNVKKNTE